MVRVKDRTEGDGHEDSEACRSYRHVARDAKWTWRESARAELHVILRVSASVRAAWRYPFLS